MLLALGLPLLVTNTVNLEMFTCPVDTPEGPAPSYDEATLLLHHEDPTKPFVRQHQTETPQMFLRKDGTCACQSGWIGADCTFDFFNSTEYLPPLVERHPKWGQEAKQLWKEFSALQLQGRSREALEELYASPTLREEFDVRDVEPSIEELYAAFNDHADLDPESCWWWDFGATGIASDLRILAKSLVRSWRYRVPMALPKDWLWARNANESVCGKTYKKSFDCYFNGIAPPACDKSKEWRENKAEAKERLVQTGEDVWARNPSQRNSVIWLQAQAISFLLRRPKEFLIKFLREHEGGSHNWFPPNSSPDEQGVKVVGMHVRMGDACFDTFSPRKCLPLSDYLDALRKLRSVYGVTKVFVATDSQDVIEQLQNNTEFEWYYLRIDRRHYNTPVLIENRAEGGVLDQAYEVQLTFADTFLLSQCDAFVGSFSSNFGRMAFELMLARRETWPPFISLDIPWCFHWVLVDEYTRGRRDVTPSCGWV